MPPPDGESVRQLVPNRVCSLGFFLLCIRLADVSRHISPGHYRQPRLAYLSESSKRTGRRPLDPPPVIRLRTESADFDDEGDGPEEPGDDAAFSRLTHNLFLFATLLPEDAQSKDDEVRQARNDLVNGTLFSSLSQFRGQSCFAFPDLNVLAEGRWRFCMSLYELSV